MWQISKVRGPWQTESDTDIVVRRKGRRRVPIVIEVEPRCIVLRAKGTRTRYRLPWGKVLDLAQTAEAEARRAAKANGRRRSVRRGAV